MIPVRLPALAVSVVFALSACGSSPAPSAASANIAEAEAEARQPNARLAGTAARCRGASPAR